MYNIMTQSPQLYQLLSKSVFYQNSCVCVLFQSEEQAQQVRDKFEHTCRRLEIYCCFSITFRKKENL